MADTPTKDERPHAFADMIGLQMGPFDGEYMHCHLDAGPTHMNPNNVVHGAILYAMADTCAGAAVHAQLDGEQACATANLAINYFRPALPGRIDCHMRVLNRGRTTAHVEGRLVQGGKLLASATGNFAIITLPPNPPK